MRKKVKWPEGTEARLEEMLIDAHGDDEQLWAIRQALEPLEDWEESIVARQ